MRKVTALTVAVAFSLVMAAPAANAFNPQPEPPGKMHKVKPGDTNRSKAIIDDNRKSKTTGKAIIDDNRKNKLKQK